MMHIQHRAGLGLMILAVYGRIVATTDTGEQIAMFVLLCGVTLFMLGVDKKDGE